MTTVKLNEDAKELETQIRLAQEAWKAAEEDLKAKRDLKVAAEKTQSNIVDSVFDGERKILEKRSSNLSGAKFKRPAIRALLESGDCELLSQPEIEDLLRFANSKTPGSLASLPKFPFLWEFPEEVWSEITSEPVVSNTTELIVSDWVREGLQLHESGDSCQFCNGLVGEQRIKDLLLAIEKAEEEASSSVMLELENCRTAQKAIQKFENALGACDFSTSIYSDSLEPKKAQVIQAIAPVAELMTKSETILQNHLKNPHVSVTGEKPIIPVGDLKNAFQLLELAYAQATTGTAQHDQNQSRAVEQLKAHCCAKSGSGWTIATQSVEKAKREVNRSIQAEYDAKKKLTELKLQVSTTADTAKFIDENLSLILGERTLRIEEGDLGEGYRITRHQKRADGMSEGEKKLVSLLYFCAEFLTEERQNSLEKTVVVFDDLGSELDESRLLMIDRFISNYFTKPKPAAIVYLTHSHTYLKILQERLGDRAVVTEKHNRKSVPSAVFYEVYKDSFNFDGQTTRCRKWEDEAVKLTNDYWLSFYMVLRAFETLQEDKVPALGTGNYCRKVLEGFTEFRAPGSERFGSRIDTILAKKGIDLSPALSKIVNGLSHSDLNKTGGVLSRNSEEMAVIQTFNLILQVDEEHFDAILTKFRGKKGKRDIKQALARRVGAVSG